MNKMIASLAVAGTLLFGAATQFAQDAEPVPVPKEVKPDAKPASIMDRRSEGEQLLGSMRDMARVAYAKTGVAPETLTGKTDVGGSGVDEAELTGKYCKVWDKVYTVKDKPERAALIAEDTEGDAGFGILKFDWATGGRNVAWFKTLEALKKGHKDVTIEDKTTSSGGDETAEAEEVTDVWALYRKEGRNWTHELAGGMTMKTTIKNVTDTGCDMETQIFMNGNALGDANITKLEFKVAEAPEGEDAPEAPKLIEKKIEVKAGTFDCISYDEGNLWLHKKYPGLVVKAQSMELIEFNENPDSSDNPDEGDKPEKPAEDEGAAKKADMSDYWARYVSTFKKGRTWTYEMMGGIQVKHEVTEVTETKATVKTTTSMGGNAIGEPTENEYDLAEPEDDGNPDESMEWVEKEVECKAGKFICVSPGHGVWMMKKHPFIVVKSDAGMELVEFKDE